MENLTKSSNVVDLVTELLNYLPSRERQILEFRHGIDCDSKSLAEIGNQFGVTRERVRQIQNNAYKKLNRMSKLTNLDSFTNEIVSFVSANGGIVLESELIDFILNNFEYVKAQIPKLLLALIIDGNLVWEHNKVNYYSHFSLAAISIKDSKKILENVISILKKKGKPICINVLAEKIKIEQKELNALVKIDKRLCLKELELSLVEWRFVNPKTLFDKILYVFNKVHKPLHFTELAKQIKNLNFASKEVCVQAIHNELISNPEFVLIGRGIYALKSWGYKEGTVADVIASVLEKKGPMHLYDLTQEVLQRRKVKPVTVQVNLNSHKSRFKKNLFGLYEVI